LLSAATISCYLSLVLGGGALFWGRFHDSYGDHKTSTLFVQGMAVISACAATVMSVVDSLDSAPVSVLMLVSAFTSMSICPVRDAVTSRYIMHDEQHGISTASFGSYRMFLPVGSGLVAILSACSMSVGDAGALLVKAVCALVASVIFAVFFPCDTVNFLLEKSVSERVELVERNPAAASGVTTPWTPVSLLFLACLCAGVANSFTETLFFPMLSLRGCNLQLLSLANCVALALECPVFYFERAWVPFLGGYTNTFVLASLAMAVRLAVISFLVGSDMTASQTSMVVVFITESLHGVTRAPVILCTARLAAELAGPGMVTTLSALLSMASGYAGQIVGMCVFIFLKGTVEPLLRFCIVLALCGVIFCVAFDRSRRTGEESLSETMPLCGNGLSSTAQSV